MIPDENHTIEMDWLPIMNVINEIMGNMTWIWLNAREIKDESMSDKQVENLDHIMDGEHRAYWMLKDLPGIFPSSIRQILQQLGLRMRKKNWLAAIGILILAINCFKTRLILETSPCVTATCFRWFTS